MKIIRKANSFSLTSFYHIYFPFYFISFYFILLYFAFFYILLFYFDLFCFILLVIFPTSFHIFITNLIPKITFSRYCRERNWFTGRQRDVYFFIIWGSEYLIDLLTHTDESSSFRELLQLAEREEEKRREGEKKKIRGEEEKDKGKGSKKGCK